MKPQFTDAPEDVYTCYGVVTNIVDGDTLDLDVALGFKLRLQNRFRLYGIDTPERGEKNWAEATEYLRSLIPPGAEVALRSYKPNVMPHADSFGRWVVEIFVGGVNVNEAMLASGLAKPFMRKSK